MIVHYLCRRLIIMARSITVQFMLKHLIGWNWDPSNNESNWVSSLCVERADWYLQIGTWSFAWFSASSYSKGLFIMCVENLSKMQSEKSSTQHYCNKLHFYARQQVLL